MVFSTTRRPHNTSLEDELDVLKAMLRQEVGYLPTGCGSDNSPKANNNMHNRVTINASDRRKLVRWCIQVMDYCKLDRSLVEVAMNYTDRYVSCPAVSNRIWTRASYQLVAMTSVYMTVKLFASEAMDPTLVSRKLSRGTYSVHDIEEQERALLQGLLWKVNPPTPSSFLAHYMDILHRCLPIPLSQQLAVYDFALQRILISVEHNQGVRGSVMALDALRAGLSRECHGADQAQVIWALSILPQPTRLPLPTVPPPLPLSKQLLPSSPPSLTECYSFETSPRSIQRCLSTLPPPPSHKFPDHSNNQ